MTAHASLNERIDAVWRLIGGSDRSEVAVTGAGSLRSCFAVTELAVASIAAATLALAEWRGGGAVSVDRRLASLWFGTSFRALDWTPPPLWDALAGDYAASDGWIRLHTNASHHRAAALKVLGQASTRDELAPRVAKWQAGALEAAVVAAGGCAAEMRDIAAWSRHPVGAKVAEEPLIRVTGRQSEMPPRHLVDHTRPLARIRVLDLTRILAGPTGTRFLAGYGADVLRIDPPGWDEGVTIPDVTLGKRCARIDLRSAQGREMFLSLLAGADIFVHGYRGDALARLGLGADVRQRAAPSVIDVALNAYGWQTPWAARRGFDSLVQMSCGIAAEGMVRFGTQAPKPLPVQALDHATGYLIAAAAIRGLTERREHGTVTTARLSLARTAALLMSWGAHAPEGDMLPAGDADFSAGIEHMSWGAAQRLMPPSGVTGAPMMWERPATALGSAQPVWLERAS